MKKLKVAVLIGTRPEAIKMAPVLLELQSRDSVESILINSGQHPTLITGALKDFGIKPDLLMEPFPPGLELSELGSRVLTSVASALRIAKPDLLLVHGDTSTTFFGALASFYAGVPVGHVEAGLRTFDTQSPFPEELNRQCVARIARWNFAPTLLAKQNLMREGIDSDGVIITGNTIVDSLRLILEQSKALDSMRDGPGDFVLVTLHRRENLADGIESILSAIAQFASSHPELKIVFPIHPNPAVRSIARTYLAEITTVEMVEPMDYRDFIQTLSRCRFVVTDSGGIQEEAVTLGKQVIVTRTHSEREEPSAGQYMKVVGTSSAAVLSAMENANASSLSKSGPLELQDTFGDGFASGKIVDVLLADFASGSLVPEVAKKFL